ncbi:MAG: hypothetical protein ED559_03975 [Phycisphaera sp.]|nr:MAG: hypothetical protein ED559_03975 [Phycisphaera sp.]
MKCLRQMLSCCLSLSASGSAADMTYGVSPDGGVYAVDLDDAHSRLLFSGPFEWLGAADSGRPGILYGAVGFDNGFESLHEIDVINQTVTPIGDWGGAEIRELAYDPARGILYGSEQDELYLIDQSTGRASLIGRYFGPSSIYAMAYLPTLDVLIGIDFATNQLYHISTETGRATLVGSTGVARITDLWFDAAAERLYGVTNFDGHVYSISPQTGAASLIGTTDTHLTGLGIGIPTPGALTALAFPLAGLACRRTRERIGEQTCG